MSERKPQEREFNIKPIGVKYICEICGEGEMKTSSDGMVLTSNPQLYPHRCTRCDGEMHLPKMYPFIDWIPEESPYLPTMDIFLSKPMKAIFVGTNKTLDLKCGGEYIITNEPDIEHPISIRIRSILGSDESVSESSTVLAYDSMDALLYNWKFISPSTLS